MNLTILAATKEQLAEALRMSEIDRIILESTLSEAEEWEALSKSVRSARKSVYLALPTVFRASAVKYFTAREELLKRGIFDGFLLRNTEGLLFLKEHGIAGRMISDHGVYVWNRESESVLSDFGFDEFTAPVELKGSELSEIGLSNAEVLVYGFLPMMVSANCLQNTVSGCDRRGNTVVLKDRQGRLMNVRKECRYCYNVILNSVPLCLSDRLNRILSLKPAGIRLHFTTESGEKTREVLSLFRQALSDPSGSYTSDSPFTRGGFERGTE